jgi:hypothetical protein
MNKPYQIIPVDVDRLRFDVRNPRYAHESKFGESSDAAIVRYLYDNDDLSELLQSIANNGFIDMEPMIVTESTSTVDEYIVLEGNRRLAAIFLLRSPSLCRDTRIDCPAIIPDLRSTLESVRAVVVPDRASARSFVGFKHINGPHRWDALAKAQFATQWLEDAGSTGNTLQSIAQSLGDSHSTVQRLVQGYYVLAQAEAKGVYNRDERSLGRKFAFSHLYTALTRPGFRAYLGLPEDWRGFDPLREPVPEDKFPQLGNVMRWLYGEKNGPQPIIKSQNPDIKNLNSVLEKPEARYVLEATGDLDEALKQVEPPERLFQTALVEAKLNAELASSHVSAYNGEDATLLATAESLRKIVVTLARTMRAIADGDDTDEV